MVHLFRLWFTVVLRGIYDIFVSNLHAMPPISYAQGDLQTHNGAMQINYRDIDPCDSLYQKLTPFISTKEDLLDVPVIWYHSSLNGATGDTV